MRIEDYRDERHAQARLETLWEKDELDKRQKKEFLALAHGISDYHARVQRYTTDGN